LHRRAGSARETPSGKDQTMTTRIRDRAEVVTRTIVQIIAQRLRDDPALRAQIADCLRDEFEDVARQTMNEIRQSDE
jgi:hypothetical protein